MKKQKIIKEWVKELLNEMGADQWGDDLGTTSSGGAETLKGIFVDPFLDVAKTAAAGVEDISSKTQLLIGGAIKTFLSAMIPFVEAGWDELKEKEKTRSEKIEAKYKDVFSRTNEAVFTGDGALVQFLWNPSVFLTTKAVQRSPIATLNLVDILSGRNEAISRITDLLRKKLTPMTGGNIKRSKPLVGASDTDSTGGINGYYGESKQNKINESEEGFGTLFNLLQSKQLRNIIENSNKAKQMKLDAVDMVQDHLDAVYRMAKEVVAEASKEKIDSFVDGKISQSMKELDEEQEEQAIKKVSSQAKSAVKKYFLEGIKKEMAMIPKGLHSYYEKTLVAIKSL